MNIRRLLTLVLAIGSVPLALTTTLHADTSTTSARTDPAYRLMVGDQIAVSVYGEEDLSLVQKIDTDGRIRLALVGDAALAGQTVREAEHQIEQLYTDRRMLRSPMVTISVQAYADRDLSILGAVRSPGKMPFPPEKSTLDITDVITRAGGFLPTAKSDAVKITRIDDAGHETTVELNVEAMLTRRGAGPNTPKEFPIHPGDRIWIPERLF